MHNQRLHSYNYVKERRPRSVIEAPPKGGGEGGALSMFHIAVGDFEKLDFVCRDFTLSAVATF